jgi:CRISPR-associated protein Csb1
MELDAERLLQACSDDGEDAGISIFTELEPLAGTHAPVKPAIYAGRKYQYEQRWWDRAAREGPVDAIVIDNVPSQANRLEAALDSMAEELGLPRVVLDLSGIASLPPHLSRQLSGFRFPHRQADAYLRDAYLEGRSFPRTEAGGRLMAATGDHCEALLEFFPQALLFGFWQSHLGKKRSQAKLARSWVSEIVGYEPAGAATTTAQLGVKGDPLNLSIDERVTFEPGDLLKGWVVEDAKKASGRKSGESLAELGHGQVPISEAEAAPTGVSFRGIEQQSTVSFAGLRRVQAHEPNASAAARALLVSIGLLAHVGAFGRSFSLRSGCDLQATMSRWTWRGPSGDETLTPLVTASARTLFHRCVALAEAAGLPVGQGWASETMVLTPSPALEKAIRLSYPISD